MYTGVYELFKLGKKSYSKVTQNETVFLHRVVFFPAALLRQLPSVIFAFRGFNYF